MLLVIPTDWALSDQPSMRSRDFLAASNVTFGTLTNKRSFTLHLGEIFRVRFESANY